MTTPPWWRSRDGAVSLVLALGMIVSLGILAAATGWQETWAAVSALSALEVSILLALSLANYILRGLRWILFCRVIGAEVRVLQGLRHYLAGFAMTVTPGRVGELVRLRWLSRETGFPLDRALPAALVDRAADLAAAGVVLVICVALSGGAGFVPVALLSIVVAALVTRERLAREIVTRAWRVTGRWPRLFARARRAARTLRPFSAPSVITAALVLGALGWAAEGYALALLLDWLGADVSVPVAVAIFLFAMVTGASTGAPGGLGGAEVALLGLLTLQGVPPAIALPATVIIRLTTLWFALAIGVLIFPYATWVSDRARTQP